MQNLEWFSCLFVLDASSAVKDPNEGSAFEQMDVDQEADAQFK